MICGNCGGSGIKTVDAMLRHQDDCYSRGWQEVMNLRKAGQLDAAAKKARKLLGVYEPMSEEDKAKLKKYAEEHKEEIADKLKLKRMTKKASKRISTKKGKN